MNTLIADDIPLEGCENLEEYHSNPAGQETCEEGGNYTMLEYSEEMIPPNASEMAGADYAEQEYLTRWWNEENVFLVASEDPDLTGERNCSSDIPTAIIDSGASSNVVGSSWPKKWSGWTADQWSKCIVVSKKQFKFGDGVVYSSMGSILMNALVYNIGSHVKIPFLLKVDIASASIPLLISRRALVRMKASIDFQTNIICVASVYRLQAQISPTGHLVLNLAPARIPILRTSSSIEIFATQEDGEVTAVNADESSNLSFEQVRKIHIQLGHASFHSLKRLILHAGKKTSEQIIYDVTRQCRCSKTDEQVQSPLVSKYLQTSVGTTVSLDVCYPWNRDRNYPCLVVVDSLSRYLAACFMPNLDAGSIIEYLLQRWIQWLGFPKFILVGAGTSFTGRSWSYFSNTFGCSILSAPPEAHYQIGRVERNLQSLKRSF